MESIAFLPCPFCGSEFIGLAVNAVGPAMVEGVLIQCQRCNANIYSEGISVQAEKELIERWNGCWTPKAVAEAEHEEAERSRRDYEANCRREFLRAQNL